MRVPGVGAERSRVGAALGSWEPGTAQEDSALGAESGPPKGRLRVWAGLGRHRGLSTALRGPGRPCPALRVVQNDSIDRFVCCLLIYSDSFMGTAGWIPAGRPHRPPAARQRLRAEMLTAQRAQPRPPGAPPFLKVLAGAGQPWTVAPRRRLAGGRRGVERAQRPESGEGFQEK